MKFAEISIPAIQKKFNKELNLQPLQYIKYICSWPTQPSQQQTMMMNDKYRSRSL